MFSIHETTACMGCGVLMHPKLPKHECSQLNRLVSIERRLAELEVQVSAQKYENHATLGIGNKPPPTDAELLAELRAELGEGWEMEGDSLRKGSHFYVSQKEKAAQRSSGWFLYSALRKHGAPVIAECLRKLAGVDA